MSALSCPHCGNARMIMAKVPRDVVVVLPCPECHELMVLFQDKAIALSREILRNGTKEERRNHIAEIVEEFLPRELFSGTVEWDFGQGGAPFPFGERPPRRPRPRTPETREDQHPPITDEEAERFYRFELHRIDEPQYFKRHFGG